MPQIVGQYYSYLKWDTSENNTREARLTGTDRPDATRTWKTAALLCAKILRLAEETATDELSY